MQVIFTPILNSAHGNITVWYGGILCGGIGRPDARKSPVYKFYPRPEIACFPFYKNLTGSIKEVKTRLKSTLPKAIKGTLPNALRSIKYYEDI